MDEKKAQNGAGNGNKRYSLAVALLGAFLGSSGSVALVFNTPIGKNLARPDPFTGSQAAALIQRVERIEAEQTNHLRQHPDQAGRFDARIAALEAQNAVIIQNQARILDRLDRLNGR